MKEGRTDAKADPIRCDGVAIDAVRPFGNRESEPSLSQRQTAVSHTAKLLLNSIFGLLCCCFDVSRVGQPEPQSSPQRPHPHRETRHGQVEHFSLQHRLIADHHHAAAASRNSLPSMLFYALELQYCIQTSHVDAVMLHIGHEQTTFNCFRRGSSKALPWPCVRAIAD